MSGTNSPIRRGVPPTLQLVRILLLGLVAWTGLGCTAVQRVPDREPKAYLKFRVQPESAEIYVDGDYRGTVEGWVEGAVPLEAGEHRVKIAADGYITRRFDVEVGAGRSKVLELEMEPDLGTPTVDTGPSRSRGAAPRSPLETGRVPGERGTPDAGPPRER